MWWEAQYPLKKAWKLSLKYSFKIDFNPICSYSHLLAFLCNAHKKGQFCYFPQYRIWQKFHPIRLKFWIKKTEIQEIVGTSFDCWKYCGLFRLCIYLWLDYSLEKFQIQIAITYLNWAEMVQRNSDTDTAKICVLSRFPPVRLFVL